jgi:putative PIN family toxin of toxin-antitoxin system
VKLVVDTNVLLAGIATDGFCRDIIKRQVLSFELFTSQVLLDELAEKLREKFHLNPGELPLLKLYASEATILKPKPLSAAICRDSDDDEVLAIALTAKADMILTGDKDLLVLKEFQGIKIISPRQFLELLNVQK